MSIQVANLWALVGVGGADKAVSDLGRVSRQTDLTQGALNRMQRATSGWGGQLVRGTSQVARGLVAVGEKAAIAAVVAGGASAKIAMDFEDAFAAVEKTVEGTPQELDKIDQALRRLSTNIPVTFQGLSTIASEAGALGVATKDIVKFTEAVARTSAATVGLSEFDASEAFGKLSTIFGLTGKEVANTSGQMISDYERLGSVLVGLGNAGASTEADIIQVGLRFAAVGQQADLSAAQVLGWSSALASLGPEAEAAGGALQRIFGRATRNIALANTKGIVGENARDRVKVFAQVTGMTVDQFVSAYAKDSSEAMLRVIKGLGGLDKFQQERALFQMGIVNIRDINAIKAFATRYEVLTQQLGIANRAWKQGTELQEVSEKRFDTLKNKAIEFKNLILVGAAAVGDGMTPAIGRLLDKAKGFANLHMGDLAQLGRDIGKAIDDINWTQVRDGAEKFVGLLREGLDLIRKVPADLAIVAAGFLGINKLSGGLLGAGLGNVVAGLGKAAINIPLNLLSRAPGVGGAIGAATATRVFVTNWPVGLGPGGLGAANPLGGPAATTFFGRLTSAMQPFIRFGALLAGIDLLANSNATPQGPNGAQTFSPEGVLGNVGGGALIGLGLGGPLGALVGAIIGAGKATVETEGALNTALATRTHAILTENLTANKQTKETLASQLAAIDSGIYRLKNDYMGLLQLTSGQSLDELQAMRADVVAKLAALNATVTANRSGSPDERDERKQQKAAVAAGEAAVTGPATLLAKLGAIGSKDDPFGFKHIKTFAFDRLGKNDPLGLKGELRWHIGETEKAIVKAESKGDTETANKLRETKAALEFMLGQVRDGTFRAGERAYAGALQVVAAVAGTTAAVQALALIGGRQWMGTTPRTGDYARGGNFYNPTAVVVEPQPVKLTLDSRTLTYAKITSDAFIRNTTG